MTIEISNAELEVLLQQRLKAERRRHAPAHVSRLAVPARGAVDEERKAKALEAAARIREIRKGITLDRPRGMSLREYAHPQY